MQHMPSLDPSLVAIWTLGTLSNHTKLVLTVPGQTFAGRMFNVEYIDKSYLS